ncbi:hypothetical protein BGW80DRAFT_725486 [Lactifluus volemus]|nr:hypothetical protein BGW80DRAFT_725486 [Lactifluus volemus]
MSQLEGPEHQALSIIGHRAANNQDRDSSDESVENEPELADSSGGLFSMYQDMTDEDDGQRAKRWLKDADGILVFTGLLTVAVVTLLTVTIPNIKQDPQETSAFYLTQLFELQLAAYENRSTPFKPDKPPSSSFPVISILANALLFICLSLNLFAAMLALLLQQWTRQYLMFTHSPRFSSGDRARVRKVFGGGPQNSPISSAIRLSMISISFSVFIFFVALLLYLIPLNQPVYICFYSCSIGCFVNYIQIKVMPRRALRLSFFATILSLQVVPEKPVWKSTKEIDDRILGQIINALRPENSDLVRFGKEKLGMAVKRLMERTWSSNSLADSDKIRRVVACVEVADAVRLSDVASSILEIVFSWDHHQFLQSVNLGRSLRNQGQEKIGDHRWIALAADQLGKSEDVIRGYLEHGQENLLLANLTYITRRIFESSSGGDQDRDMATKARLWCLVG